MRSFAVVLAFCVAAGPGLAADVLGPVQPSAMEDAVVQRGLVRAAAAGLKEVEPLGAPYAVRWQGRPVGAMVSGRGTDARLDGHEKTCFLAFVVPGAAAPSLLLTSGRWPWAQADCHGTSATAALSDTADGVRIGIVYDGATKTGSDVEPVVVLWRPGAAPVVDFTATRLASEAGADTIAAMRAALRAR